MKELNLEQLIDKLNKLVDIKASKFYAKGGPVGAKVKTEDLAKIVSLISNKQ